MNTKDNSQERPVEQTRNSRRNFLATTSRNALAIGVIATSAALAKIDTAKARDDLPDQVCNQNPSQIHNPHCICFLTGTKIRTVEGERRVEDLAIGDLLPTEFGGVRPIQWIGRYHYRKSDPSKPWVKNVRPVRISRGAIAPNVPHAELYVTQGHALFLDGVLVTAGRLVNEKTVTLYAADEFDDLEYFHIKLASHDVIYAEGVACETLLNVDENASNFAEYLRRYGAPEAQPVSCAPNLSNGARAEIKARLRVLASPWKGPCQIDVIRDRLAERAIALSGELQPLS